jgi:UDP-N-acetylmuramoylalanine--D-glutamate ligase
MFTDKKILILGMARSGYEAAKALSKHTKNIIVTDQSEQEEAHVKELKALGVEIVITKDPVYLLDESFDYVVKNPGITFLHPLIEKAKSLKIKVINEVEVAYHLLDKGVKIIGITGSNGKTTTTSLIYEVLKRLDKNVYVGGNIGYPVCSFIDKAKSGDILVLEIAGHQLHDIYDFKTDISVITNLYQVHLDFFKTYDYYKYNKLKIFNHHTEDNVAIINIGNKDVVSGTKDIKSKKYTFSSLKKADCYLKEDAIYYKKERIIETKDLRIKGEHNYENIMCAILVAKQFDMDNAIIKDAICDFPGVEHRIEFVRKVSEREFYNDSKSTNVESTIVALKSFDNSIVLILGGLDRGHPFEGLTPYMDNVRYIICYGQTKDRIYEYALSIHKDSIRVESLKDAVKLAYEFSNPKDTILLSPACASWDQYKDFEIRGKEYKKAVEELKEVAHD